MVDIHDETPREASRDFLVDVDPGSIPYSDVTQPVPRPRIQPGTVSSTIAVQIKRVWPISKSTEPVALLMKPGTISIGRRSSAARPSARLTQPPPAPGDRPARPP